MKDYTSKIINLRINIQFNSFLYQATDMGDLVRIELTAIVMFSK